MVVAPSPNAAWLACANHVVDLLIVDPNPHVSGVMPLLRAVRAFRQNIPILVLTAYDTPGLRVKIRDLGIERYVAKPVDLQELLPAVSAALAAAPAQRISGLSLDALSLSPGK